MPIIHFPARSKEARAKADELRNAAISEGRSALIVDEKQLGEPQHMLEKIVAGVSLAMPIPADKVPWKKDPLVILVGKDTPKILDDFEKRAPGFKKKFGAVKKMTADG